MFLFNGGAIGRIGHHHGVLSQVFRSFSGIVEDIVAQYQQLVAEKAQLHIIHVFGIRHGQHFRIGQFVGRLFFPVRAQFCVFLQCHGFRLYNLLPRGTAGVTGGVFLSRACHCMYLPMKCK